MPDNGCVICNCHGKNYVLKEILGCNPEDMRKRMEAKERDSTPSRDDG